MMAHSVEWMTHEYIFHKCTTIKCLKKHPIDQTEKVFPVLIPVLLQQLVDLTPDLSAMATTQTYGQLVGC